MPVYEYRCDSEDCELKYEVTCPIEERNLQGCPLCGSPGRLLPNLVTFDMGRDGTRNRNPIKMWSLEERMAAKYGDNP